MEKQTGGILLSTSTNILCERPDGSRATIEQSMEAAYEAGFRVLDLNFYDWSRPGAPFLTDRWEGWAEAVALQAEHLGIRFHQSHAYCYNYADPALPGEERRRQQQLAQRSLLCMERLGVQVAVIHPETDFSGQEVKRRSREAVRTYIAQMLELTQKSGLRMAVENMCDYNIAPRQRFCSQPEELADFVTGLNDPRVGVCWDFEHGAIMEQDQPGVIRLLGDKLTALHVSEPMSKTDGSLRHMLPLLSGRVAWEPIMAALREISYRGAFSFEAHNYSNCIPDALLPSALRLAYEVGCYLVELGEEETKL